ncbi:MAG TPA: zinc ribbon domain-containing protein [Phycisphaerae bacterium]|nr:zinc ribbon domain-containing protein [Phycisphaerae bacterium]
MIKIHDYQCQNGHIHEQIVYNDERATTCKTCGAEAGRIISLPAIHTLETHFRGSRETNAHDGSYYDENLMKPHTNEPVLVKSMAHKRQLLKERGLYEKGESPARTKAQKKTVYVDGGRSI